MREVLAQAVAVDLMPGWFKIETSYPNEKYGNTSPQMQSVHGALSDPASAAHQEVLNYYAGFRMQWVHAEDNPALQLYAAQAIGKGANAVRVLQRVVYEQAHGISRATADERTYEDIRLFAGTFGVSETVSSERIDDFSATELLPGLDSIAKLLDCQDYAWAADATSRLLHGYIGMFVDVVVERGAFPTPGISRTDRHLLTEWEV